MTAKLWRRTDAPPAIPDDRYVEAYSSKSGETSISHLDGVTWWEAASPPVKHVCWAQTRGVLRYFTYVERCPCRRDQLRLSRP